MLVSGHFLFNMVFDVSLNCGRALDQFLDTGPTLIPVLTVSISLRRLLLRVSNLIETQIPIWPLTEMDGRRTTALLVAFLGIDAISTSYAQQLEDPQIAEPPNTLCGFAGDDGMYGLGIRLGGYQLAIASAISRAYCQSSHKKVNTVNGIFQLAMLISLTSITIYHPYEDFEAVEAAIVVLFSLCSTAHFDIEDIATNRPEMYTHGGLWRFLRGSFLPLCRLMVELSITCYCVWYWFDGIDGLRRSPCTGYAFFFAKVSIFGWFRILGKATSVLFACVELWVLYRLLRLGKPLPRWLHSEKRRHHSYRINIFIDTALAAFYLLFVTFYVLSVELMIDFNHISGVFHITEVGQMIPFLAGLGCILIVLAEWEAPPNGARDGPDPERGGALPWIWPCCEDGVVFEKTTAEQVAGSNGPSQTNSEIELQASAESSSSVCGPEGIRTEVEVAVDSGSGMAEVDGG